MLLEALSETEWALALVLSGFDPYQWTLILSMPLPAHPALACMVYSLCLVMVSRKTVRWVDCKGWVGIMKEHAWFHLCSTWKLWCYTFFVRLYEINSYWESELHKLFSQRLCLTKFTRQLDHWRNPIWMYASFSQKYPNFS